MAQNTAPVAFGRAAPHAGLLTEAQCVIQARGLHRAAFAHDFGVLGLDLIFWIEDRRIEPLARSEIPPFFFLWIDVLYRHVIAPIGPD